METTTTPNRRTLVRRGRQLEYFTIVYNSAEGLVFRQPFHLSRPLTPSHESGELLHVRKRLANGGEPSIEAGALDFRFCRPLETALLVVASELELFDEHKSAVET